MRSLFTIGYEGATTDDFIATLLRARVSLVLDIRELPLSRRRGFSKSALADLLEVASIGYRHEKRLGAPAKIRHKVREDRDYTRYFQAFDRYLQTQSGHLSELIKELTGSVALLCYERNPEECHRKSVGAAISRLTGLEVMHLAVGKGSANKNENKAPRVHSRQGVSAA